MASEKINLGRNGNYASFYKDSRALHLERFPVPSD
jgi:hypothetical protein